MKENPSNAQSKVVVGHSGDSQSSGDISLDVRLSVPPKSRIALIDRVDYRYSGTCPGCSQPFEYASKWMSHKCVNNEKREALCTSLLKNVEAALLKRLQEERNQNSLQRVVAVLPGANKRANGAQSPKTTKRRKIEHSLDAL